MKSILWAALLALTPLLVHADENYGEQRMKLVADPSFNPLMAAASERSLIKEHYRRANDPSTTLEQVSEPLEQLLKLNPLSIRGNQALAGFLEHLAKNSPESKRPELVELARTKREKANGLLQSILASGDGKTAATAWVVIEISEEYALLDHLGFKKDSQALINESGKMYDRFAVKDAAGKSSEVYFDITPFFGKNDGLD